MPSHPTFPRDLSAMDAISAELVRRLDLADLLGRPLPAWLNDLIGFERFMSRIVCHRLTHCWGWSGAVTHDGHGRVKLGGKMTSPHRLTYEWLVGPIPGDLVIDHLCRNRACVNPAHLEAVTPEVNVMRGFGAPATHARKTHCPQGHPYDEENTILLDGKWRRCRICRDTYYMTNRERLQPQRKNRYAARRADEGKTVLPPNSERTVCKWGHEFTPENTRVTSQGVRQCRECGRRRDRERYANDPERKAEVKANATASRARKNGLP